MYPAEKMSISGNSFPVWVVPSRTKSSLIAFLESSEGFGANAPGAEWVSFDFTNLLAQKKNRENELTINQVLF